MTVETAVAGAGVGPSTRARPGPSPDQSPDHEACHEHGLDPVEGAVPGQASGAAPGGRRAGEAMAASGAGAQGEGGPHAALPVALHLGDVHAEPVRSWLEGVLGWQVVDGAEDDPVPPVLLLRDHLADPGGAGRPGGAGDPGRAGHPGGAGHPRPGVEVGTGSDLPTILLLRDGSDPVRAAAAAAAVAAAAGTRLVPSAVLGWPSDRERLSDVAASLLATSRQRSTSTSRLVIGGGAGGVGTTTVALALGGLRAWTGARTLVCVRGLGVPWRGVPTAALGGGDLWSVAQRSPGLESLRVVRLVDHDPVPEVIAPAIEAMVLDAGPDPDADVLVCRPDAAGLAAMRTPTAAVVVVVGEGPAPHRAVLAAAGGRALLRLPWSARVARAGAMGRLPAGLPGSWLRRLQPLVAGAPTGRATAST